MGMMDYFKVVLIGQLFYSFAVVILAYSIPTGMQHYVTSFTDIGSGFSINDTTTKVQESLSRTQNIPVIELGAMIFYSGNILIDLLINFIFAVPSMISLFVGGICNLFSLDAFLTATLTSLGMAMTTIMYIIGLLQLVTNVRSQQGLV